ncbi:thioesterase family protein [Pelagibius sp. Alg239-R121]|uniref:thioesterase family protein n=1 Tax=Pelagibius sp. Alg239-R121 TaxID=2993448 RepID=UPI0024A61809|nr:thioesterase family protein [Pelagibius sp. Alg239-R121]
MEIEAPFDQHRAEVLPEWIDYNGHMNVAYYVLAFDQATDAFFDYIGLDEAYRRNTGGSTFAVESFVTYQQEVVQGDPLRFTTQLLAHDSKRLRFFHRMYHATEGHLAATSEWLSLHVDLNIRRVAPMPPALQDRLADIWEKHRNLALPEEAGRSVRGLELPG